MESLDLVKTKERLDFGKTKTAEPISVMVFESDEGKERRTLKKQLKNVFEKIEDVNMSFDEAVDRRIIGTEDLVEIYDGLANFIEKEANNDRIILYLPFQLLPDMDRKTGNENLKKSKENFSKIYKKSWIRLLFESDLRADFTDGDVLEPGLGKPVLIRKAAHLLPEILEKKIIDIEEIENLIETVDDESLKINLTEGLVVAAERRLIDFDFNEDVVEKLLKLQESEIDGDFVVSRERVRWENRLRLNKWIDQESEIIKDELIRGNDLNELLNICQIVGVFKAGKETDLAEKYLPIIYESWMKNGNDFRNYIRSGLSHWRNLGIIGNEVLEKFKIKLPNFSETMPMEIDDLMEIDFGIFRETVDEIKKDEELMNYIYPTILTFGSRVKGYAETDADLDAAIFFRPNTPFEKREAVLEKLYEKNPKLNLVEKVLEYWIDEKEGKFGFKNIEINDKKIIGAKEIHIFWGGIWISADNEFNKFREDIKNKYLNLDRFGEQKDLVRMNFLRQLENDAIQCRLMHKGWNYFYSSKKIGGTKNSDLIDWKSNFWEPEFRRVATQIFLTKVFLPEIG